MTARLGILAVVAWIVGHWWTVTLPFSIGQHTFVCSLAKQGFLVQHLEGPAAIVANHDPHAKSSNEVELREYFDIVAPAPANEWRQTILTGAMLVHSPFVHSPIVWCCSCCHWLVVTIFAIFTDSRCGCTANAPIPNRSD